jgi:hypothetical protein
MGDETWKTEYYNTGELHHHELVEQSSILVAGLLEVLKGLGQSD